VICLPPPPVTSPSVDTERLLRDASHAMSRYSGHQRVLEAMALRLPLGEVLQRLVITLEEASPDTMGSVLLLDEPGTHVLTGAAPHLPAAFSAAIHGAPIGPAAGSCGTAAWRAELVVTCVTSPPIPSGSTTRTSRCARAGRVLVGADPGERRARARHVCAVRAHAA
jgi:hypothetical protein